MPRLRIVKRFDNAQVAASRLPIVEYEKEKQIVQLIKELGLRYTLVERLGDFTTEVRTELFAFNREELAMYTIEFLERKRHEGLHTIEEVLRSLRATCK
jgi:hypothetical protein